MRQDRSHHQRGGDDLGQSPQACVEHPRLVAPTRGRQRK
jgi:hypothetical protein